MASATKWMPKGAIVADGGKWVPEGAVPVDTSADLATTRQITSFGGHGDAREIAGRFLDTLPYAGGMTAGFLASPALATGPAGIAAEIAAAGAGAGVGQTLRNAGRRFLSLPAPAPGMDEERDVMGAAVGKGALPQAGGIAIGGLADAAAGGLRRIATAADARTMDAAERKLRVADREGAPGVAAERAATDAAQQELAGVADLTQKLRKSNKLTASVDAGAAADARRKGVSAVQAGARRATNAAKNISTDVAQGVEVATEARRTAAAATRNAIESAQSAGAKPITIQEIADDVIAQNEAVHGPMNPKQKAKFLRVVKSRASRVLPEFSQGRITGRKAVYSLEEAQLAKQYFQRNAHPELGAISRGKLPKPDWDLPIASAWQRALEDRVPELKSLNQTTQSAIKDVQGVKALENRQPTPTVAEIKGRQAGRVESVRTKSTETAGEIERQTKEQLAKIRRDATENARKLKARADAESARINAEHELEVARIRLEKRVKQARALSVLPGTSELPSIHVGLSGVRVGTPTLSTAPVARGVARFLESTPARAAAVTAPYDISHFLESLRPQPSPFLFPADSTEAR